MEYTYPVYYKNSNAVFDYMSVNRFDNKFDIVYVNFHSSKEFRDFKVPDGYEIVQYSEKTGFLKLVKINKEGKEDE